MLSLLKEDWKQAEKEAQWFAERQGERFKMMGAIALAATGLYQGHSRGGLRVLEQTAASFESDTAKSYIRNFSAFIFLQLEIAEKALEQARKARIEGKEDYPEREGLFVSSLALARLGRRAEAEETAETLRLKAEALPSQMEKRRYHHLMGELALHQGDIDRALEELEQARSMLPARGFNWIDRRAPHVPIWYSLAQAHWKAGDVESAAQWFGRITESTTEHIYWPIPYVRSFYFLAKIHENQGEADKARAYYQRFYDYWKDGDMDRDRVEEVETKLRSYASN
jgi:tetratricopeptide (TPR) repeat protein